MSEIKIDNSEIDKLYNQLQNDAQASEYHLNPDEEFTKDLIHGLLINEKRYGYQSCPCRIASGNKQTDLDIICPCDYRDPDLDDYGACYCALYVSEDILKGKKKLSSIPERRLPPEKRTKIKTSVFKEISLLSLPVWRCKVCGYLCARENPPEVCPICKVKNDRFERFI